MAQLILLTIDEVEALETSTQHFAMVDCLQEYAAASPDRLVSFHNFLATSTFRQQLRYNASLAARCIEILERCMARLFPHRDSLEPPASG